MKQMLEELKENESLIQKGNDQSSSGSDGEPSEDNLPVEEIVKIIPVLDKKTKLQFQKY